MENSLVRKLAENKKLSLLERDVLNYIVKNSESVSKMGIREVAKNMHTSTSTIMRLSKKLGFNGYIDMNYKLIPLIEGKSFEKQENYEGIFDGGGFLKLNEQAVFKEIGQILTELDKQFIFVYANGFSGIIAEYLYKKLLVLGKRVMFSTGNDSVGVFENNLEDIGLFITISKSGETQKVIEKATTARENKIPVISFTNDGYSALSELSTHWIKIKDTKKYDDYNASPNNFFPQVLMALEVMVYEYTILVQNQLKQETSS
ncbi:MurR/RpiR family transcriptional regulator [Vagococcus intermedius]|uniref:MurR/RpiR family transcriptional regulator n=1 Tax=Vagococcus intermedius TaxID=2991418 RepID=A0AAF0CWB3_9ENTE|nr:MurR/RpiR family transcriptional regulator [Vagococcus intermedius]WEG74016.1 MurR/RpiR family transcriptional regulator [Vagococcus intermedius]WEG76096.1 MurR/RpiR family transcriptional regulator [Vagococcus intermedius]